MTDIIKRIDTEMAQLSQALHSDKRATRDAEGKVLPEAKSILAERTAIKERRKQLRVTRARLMLDKEASTMPRAIEEIEAELAPLIEKAREVKARMRMLNRERDRALLVAEVEQMPEAKRAALAAMLAPKKS